MKCGKTYCRYGRTEKWSSRNYEIWRKCTEANEFKNVPKFMKKMCQLCLKYTRCALSFSVVSKAIYIQGKCVVSNVAAHADFKSFKENWNHCLGHITTESTSAGISSIWWHYKFWGLSKSWNFLPFVQVKEAPTSISWPTEDGSLYTLLMTGMFHHFMIYYLFLTMNDLIVS